MGYGVLEDGLSDRGSAGVSVGKIPGTGGLQHVATEVQGARREWESWRRRGATEVHATTCSACASPRVGGTSLPETGGGWPDSVRSLAGPNESVLCTIHIPHFLGATMLAFIETLVNIVATGITGFVDAVVALIK